MSKKVLVVSMGKAGSTTVINTLKSAGIEYGRLHWNNRHEVDTSQYDYFIAMAREPVARAISDYFESGVDIQAGIAKTLVFFDEVVEKNTGFHIYDQRDKKEHNISWGDSGLCWGWQIHTYTDRQKSLLVTKVEDFNVVLSNGLSHLIEMRPDLNDKYHMIYKYPWKITHHPKGSERFGPKYDEFRANFRLPHDYLKQVANSRYCQYFGYQDAVMAWSE